MKLFLQHFLLLSRNKTLPIVLAIFLINLDKVQAAEPELGLMPIEIGNATLMANIWTPESIHFETIIALPGSGGDTSRFRLLGPLLANAGFQLVALNQRGIMVSTGALDDLTLYDFADDVIAVADTLKLDTFHMLGWALGNRTSRAAATKYPDRIATVSLIAAGGLANPLTVPGELGRLLGDPELTLDQKVALARRTLFSQASPEELVRHYAASLNYWPDARQSQIQANRSTPLKQWWAGGIGPMLIIQGLDDKTAPPENGERMKKEFGERITLVNLPNAGHLMGIEKPEATALAITAFLKLNSINK